MIRRSTTTLLLIATALIVFSPPAAEAASARARSRIGDDPPNILFVIMDDVGIDQMRAFGYGGVTPPSTPSIDQLAQRGVRFRNTWAMPACTTSRAVIFDGRFPLRTNVYGALGPNDLANSMVNPFEMTAPRVLAERGYHSALFGKFHLGLQGNNSAGLAMPHDLGWDYFAGWLDDTGDPSSIDTTAGGVAAPGTWSCGFVPGASAGGADSGACYMPTGSCEALAAEGTIPPGRICRDRGGILDPGASCQSPPPAYVDFDILSGHYVSPYVVNREDGTVEEPPLTDARPRRFRATAVVDDAIAWINERPTGRPWMATVSFASAHTPVMQPPVDQAKADLDHASALDCANIGDQRVLTNLMIESLDTEMARLLVDTGLARRTRKGRLVYRPKRTNTMVILVGDNGSLGTVVKEPFNPNRAKGTAYQTGVWVPLVVAGPLVRRPDRIVSSMVNVADLFQLFGEIAGLDVHELVPRPIDSHSMLPYLVNPKQASIRRSNFTQVGLNSQANGTVNGPCTITVTCTQIPVSKSVCEDNNGVWWGVGADNPETAGSAGLERCCDVNAYRIAQGALPFMIAPDFSLAIRNDTYKLVQNTTMLYQSQEDPCVETVETELYEIDEAVPIPLLDNVLKALPLDALTPVQQANYDALSAELTALLQSAPACEGDGNIDGVVDSTDLGIWAFYGESWGLSSVYDIDENGLTNTDDRTLIADHLGACPSVSAP
ncbi:MAG TPA: sulfatase-like hydrolase/transferase [Candidatus Binatia bacterium]|jgi:arylsulfatase A-like enzyme|nr:sulfatase-like hydrolase/transferase [Candidatus Binatia bacterium]